MHCVSNDENATCWGVKTEGTGGEDKGGRREMERLWGCESGDV